METAKDIAERFYQLNKNYHGGDWVENLEKEIEKYAEAKAGQHETIVIDWIEFKGNEKLFNEEAKKNCKIMFDDGSVCRYNDKHPRAIMTHFKIESQ